MVELPAMANYPLNRDCIDMSKFDEISELAIDNYGIVTAADEYEEFLPEELTAAFEEMQFPRPQPLRVMKLSYQIAQKLHALSEEGSDRAHDLIDLMLIGRQSQLDFVDIKSKCMRLFDYRRKQAWPPEIKKGDEWDAKYDAALGTIRDNSDICRTVDEAVAWTNEFVAKIVQA